MTMSLRDAASQDSPVQALPAGEQLAMTMTAGAELFCASGSLRVLVTPCGGPAIPLSLELAAGRAWRCGESTRVLITAQTPSRVIVHEPQRPAENIAARGFPAAAWWRLARVRRAA